NFAVPHGLRSFPTGDLSNTAAVQPAHLHRLRTFNEKFGPHLWAGRSGQFAGQWIDLDAHHTRGRFKFADVPILAVLVSPLHELSPNGQSGFRTLQIQLTVSSKPT